MPKGGFRPGAGRKKASHTLEAEAYRKRLIKRVLDEETINALTFPWLSRK